ncbi:MAG TPA: hypothetical protein PL033_02470 [Candidatus Brocadiia bacterium]|nr:hypothetical protein [Candidatus Brocadiia bacterium]
MWWHYLLGYGYAVFCGNMIGAFISAARADMNLRRKLNVQSEIEANRVPWHPKALGMLERPFIMTLFIYGKYDYIAGWYTVKTVVQWKAWTEERTIFNLYLISTLLSFGYAVAGGVVARTPFQLVIYPYWLVSFAAMTIPVFANLYLLNVAVWNMKKASASLAAQEVKREKAISAGNSDGKAVS